MTEEVLAEEPFWWSYTRDEAISFYHDRHKAAMDADPSGEKLRTMTRHLAERDLFYLLTHVLRRHDANHPWIYERCREFERDPDGHLDLWARFHYKSTVITFAATIQEIIKDPEITICFLSHNGATARSFLLQIKSELEQNKELWKLWPEIFFEDPKKQSPKWNETDGLLVKRTSNSKELTLQSSGLVDGMPTGMHFKLRVYDDVVTEDSIGTPEQIQKTTKAWELSSNLGTEDGGRQRYAGTRYHLFDTYAEMIKRGAVKPRIHAATHDGKETGSPVLLTRAVLRQKRIEQGPYTFGSQLLLNPTADKAMGFLEKWLVIKSVTEAQAQAYLNIYIICDPASSKKRKNNDYTCFWVIGVSAAKDYYILDCVRDRLNLGQRARTCIDLHRKWQPIGVGYEEYGRDADIEHINFLQDEELYNFEITPLGGTLHKFDRIKKLVPICEQKRIIIPPTIIKYDYTGAAVDLIKIFKEEEYLAFPVSRHDDMLDSLARIEDPAMHIIFPDPKQKIEELARDYSKLGMGSQPDAGNSNSWMTG